MAKAKYTGLMSIITSFLAASCCIGPAIFVLFGTSVGFLGKLAFLNKYRPYLLSVAFLMLGYSFWSLYIKKPDCTCAEDIRNRKIARVIFWIGLGSFLFALSFQRIILWLYG